VPLARIIARNVVVTAAEGEIHRHPDSDPCADWDTGATSREMKDNQGNWYTVGDN
jgi:hypothetical protein